MIDIVPREEPFGTNGGAAGGGDRSGGGKGGQGGNGGKKGKEGQVSYLLISRVIGLVWRPESGVADVVGLVSHSGKVNREKDKR